MRAQQGQRHVGAASGCSGVAPRFRRRGEPGGAAGPAWRQGDARGTRLPQGALRPEAVAGPPLVGGGPRDPNRRLIRGGGALPGGHPSLPGRLCQGSGLSSIHGFLVGAPIRLLQLLLFSFFFFFKGRGRVYLHPVSYPADVSGLAVVVCCAFLVSGVRLRRRGAGLPDPQSRPGPESGSP